MGSADLEMGCLAVFPLAALATEPGVQVHLRTPQGDTIPPELDVAVPAGESSVFRSPEALMAMAVAA